MFILFKFFATKSTKINNVICVFESILMLFLFLITKASSKLPSVFDMKFFIGQNDHIHVCVQMRIPGTYDFLFGIIGAEPWLLDIVNYLSSN